MNNKVCELTCIWVSLNFLISFLFSCFFFPFSDSWIVILFLDKKSQNEGMKGRGVKFGKCYNRIYSYDRKQKPNFDTTLPVPRLGRQSVPNLSSVLSEVCGQTRSTISGFGSSRERQVNLGEGGGGDTGGGDAQKNENLGGVITHFLPTTKNKNQILIQHLRFRGLGAYRYQNMLSVLREVCGQTCSSYQWFTVFKRTLSKFALKIFSQKYFERMKGLYACQGCPARPEGVKV